MGRRRQDHGSGQESGRTGHGRRPNLSVGNGRDAEVSHRQVQVMSTLPLKAMSRLWGKFNELDIPYYLRVPGFKLYSFIFGVKLVQSPVPILPQRPRY